MKSFRDPKYVELYMKMLFNMKNLLEYSPSYAENTASNEFVFLDTSRNLEEQEFEVSGTNRLAKR